MGCNDYSAGRLQFAVGINERMLAQFRLANKDGTRATAIQRKTPVFWHPSRIQDINVFNEIRIETPTHLQESFIETKFTTTIWEMMEQKMNNQGKNWIAILCAMTIWFSFIASHSIQGAQIDSSITAGQSISESVVPDTDTLPASPIGLPGIEWGSITTIVASAGALLIGFNLITAKKQGWGWYMLCVLGAVLAIFARLSAALFCEISSDATGISDWDSD